MVRASGSVAANWIEADEALGKKDFLMRVKICRKESKESRLFLRLVDTGLSKNSLAAGETLASEARELTLIFSSIISNMLQYTITTRGFFRSYFKRNSRFNLCSTKFKVFVFGSNSEF